MSFTGTWSDWTLEEKARTLREYAALEGSEAGEYWSLLCSIAQCTYCLSPEFKVAVIAEIEKELQYIRDNLEIVEREKITTQTVKYLEEKQQVMKTHLSKITTQDIVIACPVMKNNHNVSMIVRSAACLGASKVIITGQNKVNKHISRDCDIEIVYKNSLLPVIKEYRKQGYRIVALEQDESSISIHELKITSPILLTMGGEAKGMDQEILDQTDEIVEIPLYGNPYSLNVAMSVSICLNEIARQGKV